MHNFSDKLQELLSVIGWTQLKLSESIGVTEQTISRWMKINKMPSRSNLVKISRATGCNLQWLRNPNYDGPIMEKGRWAYEADDRFARMGRREIDMVYSRLKEIKEAKGFNTAQLLAASDINIHATENDRHYLGFPPYGQAIEKIGMATGFNKDWILAGIGPKYVHTDKIEDARINYELHGGWKPRTVGEDYEYAGKALEILSSKTSFSILLKANITAFYNAMKAEEGKKDLQKKMKELKLRIEDLEAKRKRGDEP